MCTSLRCFEYGCIFFIGFALTVGTFFGVDTIHNGKKQIPLVDKTQCVLISTNQITPTIKTSIWQYNYQNISYRFNRNHSNEYNEGDHICCVFKKAQSTVLKICPDEKIYKVTWILIGSWFIGWFLSGICVLALKKFQ